MNQDRLQEMLAGARQSFDYSAAEIAAAGGLRFVLGQTFRYSYAGPVSALRQRLLTFPPELHGDQHRVISRLETDPSGPGADWTIDEYGNVVVSVAVPKVARSATFSIGAVIDRGPVRIETKVDGGALDDSTYLAPTPLTFADARLTAAAHDARGSASNDIAAAERVCEAAHRAIRYQKGVTNVDTPASVAFEIGAGVCQDHAHVMLAMCRALGIRARYVSGHMLGEGSTHAWVEVLVPDADDPAVFTAVPFDPCHLRKPDLSYITIAVGRDYSDVPPTSGTYSGAAANQLTSHTVLGVTLKRND